MLFVLFHISYVIIHISYFIFHILYFIFGNSVLLPIAYLSAVVQFSTDFPVRRCHCSSTGAFCLKNKLLNWLAFFAWHQLFGLQLAL